MHEVVVVVAQVEQVGERVERAISQLRKEFDKKFRKRKVEVVASHIPGVILVRVPVIFFNEDICHEAIDVVKGAGCEVLDWHVIGCSDGWMSFNITACLEEVLRRE